MIVVKVELWPGGDADKAESLGVVCIANRGPVDGGVPEDLFNYSVELQGTKHARTSVFHYRRRGWLRLVASGLGALDRE